MDQAASTTNVLLALWRLRSDDVEIEVRTVASDHDPPMMRVTISHTALDEPQFSFTVSLKEFQEMCSEGLRFG